MQLKIYALFTLLVFSSVQCNQPEEQECPQNPISSFGNSPDFDRQVRGYGKSDLAGGPGSGCLPNYDCHDEYESKRFDDEIPKNKVVRITRLRIWDPDYVKGIETTFELQNGRIIKSLSGFSTSLNPKVIDLDQGDTIVEVKVLSDHNVIGQIHITIKLQTGDTETHQFGYYRTKPVAAVWKGPILGFYGFYSEVITAIGVYYARTAVHGPKFGGSGGAEWTDPILTHTPQISNIDKIIIHHGMSIDSIQVYYLTMWGDVVRGDSHGGTGGTPETIDLEPGEMIIQMDTTSSGSLLSSVMFTSMKLDGTEVQYGPYGKANNNKEGSTSGKIIGFYGTEGDVLDSLGVYTMDC